MRNGKTDRQLTANQKSDRIGNDNLEQGRNRDKPGWTEPLRQKTVEGQETTTETKATPQPDACTKGCPHFSWSQPRVTGGGDVEPKVSWFVRRTQARRIGGWTLGLIPWAGGCVSLGRADASFKRVGTLQLVGAVSGTVVELVVLLEATLNGSVVQAEPFGHSVHGDTGRAGGGQLGRHSG